MSSLLICGAVLTLASAATWTAVEAPATTAVTALLQSTGTADLVAATTTLLLLLGYAACVWIASFLVSYAILQPRGWLGGNASGGKRVVVLCLGDIGRSPRMQYHALSLATQARMEVDIVAYGGKELFVFVVLLKFAFLLVFGSICE